MITYYHKQTPPSRYGPGDKLAGEMTARVLHIDLFLDREKVDPKRRLEPSELERAQVRLGVTCECPDEIRKRPEPDISAFVDIRALRHEVKLVWRAIDEELP